MTKYFILIKNYLTYIMQSCRKRKHENSLVLKTKQNLTQNKGYCLHTVIALNKNIMYKQHKICLILL